MKNKKNETEVYRMRLPVDVVEKVRRIGEKTYRKLPEQVTMILNEYVENYRKSEKIS